MTGTPHSAAAITQPVARQPIPRQAALRALVQRWSELRLVGDGPMPWLAGNFAAAFAYAVLGLAVSQFFAAYSLFPAPIWLPASVAVVAALAGGLRLAPGLFVGSMIANFLVFQAPFYEAAIISLGNSLGPVIGAALTRRFQPAEGLFERFSGVVVFVACNILIHPALTASTGAFAIALANWMANEPLPAAAIYSIWIAWWLCDSGGTLFFAPAVLLWLGVEKLSQPVGQPFRGPAERGDLAVWGAVAAISVLLFAPLPAGTSLAHGTIHWALPFMLVLPVSWVALRMSLRASYSLISLVAVIACVGTVIGYGPFRAPGIGNPMQLVGVLIVILALNVLTIGALLNERRVAEEISKCKSQFLANMSHDLRTPLNAIIGFSDLIRNESWGPVGNDRYREYVGHINESGLMLLGLMNDILDLSKIEAGRRDIQPSALDWRQIVDSCLSMVGPRAVAKGVQVEATAASGVQVFADDLAFRQILLNLLSNAVKFTGPGGRVSVSLGTAGDGATVVEVADTGIGMTAEDIRTALEPYGQVREITQRREPGTGLGLPISVRLAELHGGRLAIDSAAGKGTTVRVTFPPAPAPATPVAA
ncbi:MAG: MASE1 domain-containing protein [Rhodospirillales bacterium]|nr:MASE1 domain-containing protein [Rhodospirillales bacterium]